MKNIKFIIVLICSMGLLTETWSSCFAMSHHHHHHHSDSYSYSYSSGGSMNNEGAGTLIGALTGGLLGSTIGHGGGRFLAVAAGTIAGAVLGGSVGKSMDKVDRMKMYGALERNPIGRPAYWRNEHTGTKYEVIPVRNVVIEDNEYCREYRTIAYIGGKKKEVYGTACRQPDGSWRAVN